MFFPGQQFTGDISQWSSTKAECEQVSLSSKGLRPPLNKSGVGLLAGRRLSRQDTLLITVPTQVRWLQVPSGDDFKVLDLLCFSNLYVCVYIHKLYVYVCEYMYIHGRCEWIGG
jgi:hypothetical protein